MTGYRGARHEEISALIEACLRSRVEHVGDDPSGDVVEGDLSPAEVEAAAEPVGEVRAAPLRGQGEHDRYRNPGHSVKVDPDRLPLDVEPPLEEHTGDDREADRDKVEELEAVTADYSWRWWR